MRDTNDAGYIQSQLCNKIKHKQTKIILKRHHAIRVGRHYTRAC